MSQAIKVGIFATIVLAILAVLILRVEDLSLFAGPGQRVEASFESVAGLDDKSAVRVAGVRIGRVDGIRLEGRQAIVSLLLEQPVELTEGAEAVLTTAGLLGDKYIELDPGPLGGPPLPEGTRVPGITPVGIDEAIARLNAIGESVEEVTSSLAGDVEGENRIARLLENLEIISSDVRDLLAANRAEVSSTIANFESASATLARELPRIASRMEEVLAEVGEVVKENRGELAASLDNVREITDGLKPSIDDLNQISGRLARGEGTIGKLLTSDETHDRLVSTLTEIEEGVEGLSDTLEAVNKIRLDLGMEGYFLEAQDEGQAAFQLDIETRSEWNYRIAVADVAGGQIESRTERITTTFPDGSSETETIQTLTTEDDLAISALLGYDLPREMRLWTGLIESSFGVQLEVPVVDRRLLLSVEAFDFNREDDLEPHLRLSGRWRLDDNFYLIGGYDDLLADERDSLFVGAGIRWNDDDLKFLLGSAPRF